MQWVKTPVLKSLHLHKRLEEQEETRPVWQNLRKGQGEHGLECGSMAGPGGTVKGEAQLTGRWSYTALLGGVGGHCRQEQDWGNLWCFAAAEHLVCPAAWPGPLLAYVKLRVLHVREEKTHETRIHPTPMAYTDDEARCVASASLAERSSGPTLPPHPGYMLITWPCLNSSILNQGLKEFTDCQNLHAKIHVVNVSYFSHQNLAGCRPLLWGPHAPRMALTIQTPSCHTPSTRSVPVSCCSWVDVNRRERGPQPTSTGPRMPPSHSQNEPLTDSISRIGLSICEVSFWETDAAESQ
jgi:hypothetical protein